MPRGPGMGRTKGSKKSKGDGCLAPESMTLMCSKPGGGRIFAATEGVVLNALKLDSVTPVAGEYDRHAGVSLGSGPLLRIDPSLVI